MGLDFSLEGASSFCKGSWNGNIMCHGEGLHAPFAMHCWNRKQSSEKFVNKRSHTCARLLSSVIERRYANIFSQFCLNF